MFRQKYRRVCVPRDALAIVNSRGDCHNKRDDRAGVTANRESRDNKRMKEENGRVGFRQTHIWPSFPLFFSLSPSSIVHLARSGILGEDVATRNGKGEKGRKEGRDAS